MYDKNLNSLHYPLSPLCPFPHVHILYRKNYIEAKLNSLRFLLITLLAFCSSLSSSPLSPLFPSPFFFPPFYHLFPPSSHPSLPLCDFLLCCLCCHFFLSYLHAQQRKLNFFTSCNGKPVGQGGEVGGASKDMCV